MKIVTVYENLPENLKWVIENDPRDVQDILKYGRRLENAHVKMEVWSRREGPEKHRELFEKLQSDRVSVRGEIRKYSEWCYFWRQNRQEKELAEAAAKSARKLEKARQAAINRALRDNPGQENIRVVQEESPERIEELSSSSSSSSSLLLQLMSTQERQEARNRPDFCARNSPLMRL